MFVFLWVRATFPRYRYDQLMRLGWKVFLPLSLFWVVLTAGVVVAFDLVPARESEHGPDSTERLRPAPVRAR